MLEQDHLKLVNHEGFLHLKLSAQVFPIKLSK